jgi:hypothetical protein
LRVWQVGFLLEKKTLGIVKWPECISSCGRYAAKLLEWHTKGAQNHIPRKLLEAY